MTEGRSAHSAEISGLAWSVGKVRFQSFKNGLGRKGLLNKTRVARKITLFRYSRSGCDDHLYVRPPLDDLPGQFKTVKVPACLHIREEQLQGAVFFEKRESFVGRCGFYDIISRVGNEVSGTIRIKGSSSTTSAIGSRTVSSFSLSMLGNTIRECLFQAFDMIPKITAREGENLENRAPQ